MNDKYCHHIEHGLAYDVNGRTAPCCQFRGNNDPTYIKPEDYFQSDWLANIKQQMYNGEEIEGCQRCYKDEAISGNSYRTSTNQSQEKKLHFTYSNICNKSCNVCRPQRSHLVGLDYKKVLEKDPDNYFMQEKFKKQENTAKIVQSGKLKLESIVDWVAQNKFKNVIHRFNLIEFDGGEPFMHPELHKMFDMLLEENYQGQLVITSNGSVNVDYLEKLKQFNKVKIRLSIDGVYDLYEVVRPPHKWDWLVEKVNLIKQYKNIELGGSAVIHVFNVHQLSDMILEFEKLGFNKISLNPLGQQEYLHASLCPEEVLQDSIKQIENIDSQRYSKVINYLKGCISKTVTTEQVKLFHAYIDSFGPVKNINYQQYIPWNFELIK